MTARDLDVARTLGIALPFDDVATLPPPELFPKKPAWVAREIGGRRVLDVMTWGFPHKVKSPKTGKISEKPVTNVRNYASTFWRMAMAAPSRRCLVPVTEFSEYGPGVPGKLPLYWFSVPSRPIFAFAGVWRPLADGAVFAFLTCAPNPLVAALHPKAMPVILHEDDYDRWLTCDFDAAVALAAPYPSQLMASTCAAVTDAAGADVDAEEVPSTGLLDVVADWAAASPTPCQLLPRPALSSRQSRGTPDA